MNTEETNRLEALLSATARSAEEIVVQDRVWRRVAAAASTPVTEAGWLPRQLASLAAFAIPVVGAAAIAAAVMIGNPRSGPVPGHTSSPPTTSVPAAGCSAQYETPAPAPAASRPATVVRLVCPSASPDHGSCPTTQGDHPPSPLPGGPPYLMAFSPASPRFTGSAPCSLTLYLHCGFQLGPDFDGSFWDLAPGQKEPHEAARPMGDGSVELADHLPGRIHLVGGDRALFVGSDGQQLRLVRHHGTKTTFMCY